MGIRVIVTILMFRLKLLKKGKKWFLITLFDLQTHGDFKYTDWD